jgi:Transmembrane protein 33/Nucleoporin POM33
MAFYGMAVMDLTLLGVLIGRAFTQKMLLLPFVYVNMLRHRYKAPVSAKYHQAVWAVLVSNVEPVMKRMPSSVQSGVGYLTRWFTGSTV